MPEFDPISYAKASRASRASNEIANQLKTINTFDVVADVWEAIENQTEYTLSSGKAYDTDKPVIVWIDGIPIFAIGSTSDGLVRTSTTKITLNTGVELGSEVVFLGFMATSASENVIEVTGNKTLTLTDAGSYQVVTESTTIIIPADDDVNFRVGTEIQVFRDTDGYVEFTAAEGVTLKTTDDKNSIENQYDIAYLKKVAANTWHLVGNLKSTVIKYTNAILNGNFTNTSNWSAVSGSVAASNNLLTLAASGSGFNPRITQTTQIDCVNGKKVFVHALIKVDNAVCNHIGIEVYGSVTVGTTQSEYVNAPTQDEEYIVSAVLTVPSNAMGKVAIAIKNNYADNSAASGKVMTVRNAIAYELAGELADKDKAWCLANIVPNIIW